MGEVHPDVVSLVGGSQGVEGGVWRDLGGDGEGEKLVKAHRWVRLVSVVRVNV